MDKIRNMKDFKLKLCLALTCGYKNILELDEYADYMETDIVKAISKIPSDMNCSGSTVGEYLNFLSFSLSILEDEEEYKLLIDIIETAKKEYGTSELFHNYRRSLNIENKEKAKIIKDFFTEINKEKEAIEETIENNESNEDNKNNLNINIDFKAIDSKMKAEGYTQDDIAYMLDISPRSMNRKLKGETDFKALEFIKVLRILDLNINSVIKED